MGFWLLLAWLDAGVPTSTMVYTGLDEQRCPTVVHEHLDSIEARPDAYVETLYIGCVQGGAPRRMR